MSIAVLFLGTVIFTFLFGLKSGLENEKFGFVLEWSFELEQILESSSLGTLEKSNDSFLENREFGFKDKNIRLTNVLLDSVFQKDKNRSLDLGTKINKKSKESEKSKTGKFHLETFLEIVSSVFTNQPEITEDSVLVSTPELNSTDNLGTVGAAWEVDAELAAIQNIEIDHPQNNLNLDRVEEIGLQLESKLAIIQKRSALDELSKLNFLKRNLIEKFNTVSFDFLNQKSNYIQNTETIKTKSSDELYIQKVGCYLSDNTHKKNAANVVVSPFKEHSKIAIDLSWNLDPKFSSLEKIKIQSKSIEKNQQETFAPAFDFEFKDRVKSKTLMGQSEKFDFSTQFFIREFGAELEMSDKALPDSALWEWKEDTFEIRILENVHIERWAWNQIQEKLEEFKNNRLQNNIPSLAKGVKEGLLFFPRRTQSNFKNQDVVSVHSGYTWKDSYFLILDHFLETPKINRKWMRYYSIHLNGPPFGILKKSHSFGRSLKDEL
ncbi:hypothetical protein LEP1GSC021_5058 [Leptospira noguchii str. 1993005606]|uniref:Uncharacterized protein n=2 Tax=Leptospira noguchii TaxID=28182 RepID=M6Y7N2_9LEPT|nr:hypothetical protein [Leptospira noguchii]EMN01887.1 hypothetical protein LEP1GSC035_4685 [Leptospira noguchii str. 2007001578]EMO90347.1 hypothetical protein LEP1GSC024_0004 [Leptospira noguchii str. 2001034031]EPE84909.1 hypothetical protein LEP1GSC021_5058 [Leptospira noguchii str. 1993005606]